jgi:hypothetical protein
MKSQVIAFEPQNVEQGISNFEVLYFCGSKFLVRYSKFPFRLRLGPFEARRGASNRKAFGSAGGGADSGLPFIPSAEKEVTAKPSRLR